jgi:hypothetical protein
MIIVPNESRPDLAVGLSKKALAGAATMIAPVIFPQFTVSEKTGTIAAAQVIHGTGQKNRAKGANVTATRVEAKDVTYTVNSYEGRDILSDVDVKDAGGLDNALQAGARGAGYDAIALLERDARDELENNSDTTRLIDVDKPFDALFQCAQDVKDYGKPLLVCSESFIRKFVAIPAVSKVLVDLFGHGWFNDIRNLGNVNKALGAAFGVDSVVIGDDQFWIDSTAAYVVGYRPEAQTDARNVVKRLPSLGFMPVFLPEENSTVDEPFAVSTVYLPETKDSAVDVDLYAVPKVVNHQAIARIAFQNG